MKILFYAVTVLTIMTYLFGWLGLAGYILKEARWIVGKRQPWRFWSDMAGEVGVPFFYFLALTAFGLLGLFQLLAA